MLQCTVRLPALLPPTKQRTKQNLSGPGHGHTQRASWEKSCIVFRFTASFPFGKTKTVEIERFFDSAQAAENRSPGEEEKNKTKNIQHRAVLIEPHRVLGIICVVKSSRRMLPVPAKILLDGKYIEDME